MRPLTKNFFNRDAVTAAQELLGKIVCYNGCSGRIVEAEAYQSDPASHAFRRTKRSSIMFDTYAHWYIYLIYGMHYCLNITTNGTKEPGAVLIRAIEPVDGIETMKKRRKIDNLRSLCSGPGKLCQALGIDKSLDKTQLNDKIKIFGDEAVKEQEIIKTQRIGIREGRELMWRFYVKGNNFVSCQ